ncbi:2-acylglycerol O-acyltransferase 2-like [Watersipora subatra]|uniref:2-acylglycerol O-acyltransferase 2-like n=1 Tax=Watersipora subatra TaxID=2589382 RepID=UPI00355B880C
MAKIMGIEFAPLIVPLKRRLQVFAVAQWVSSFMFLGFFSLFTVSYLAFTRWWPLVAVYLVWFVYDRNTPSSGGRRMQAVRNSSLWKCFRDYFPLTLVKSCDFDTKKNYIFALHPHGVLCVSQFCSFATEGTGFSKLFPGLTPHLLVLDGHFLFPVYRDYVMTTGMCRCNKQSLEHILSSSKKGNVACLAVGGALETFEAHPQRLTLVLQNRKGFIKSALRTGASLVPVFSFGENELYDQLSNPIGSKLRNFQHWVTKYLGTPPPFFHGRGIIQYSFGFIPHRKPVTTVVGAPIEVKQTKEPTNEEIKELHSKYVAALCHLFEKHKRKYGIPANQHLKFI